MKLAIEGIDEIHMPNNEFEADDLLRTLNGHHLLARFTNHEGKLEQITGKAQYTQVGRNEHEVQIGNYVFSFSNKSSSHFVATQKIIGYVDKKLTVFPQIPPLPARLYQ
jgi:hypothetical protein